MRLKIFLFLLVSFLATDISFAAGMIARVQQMKAQRQRQSGQMTEEQYEAYQEQQQAAQGQNQQAQAPAPPSYQQTVDQRNQAIAQAILNAHNQAVSTESVAFGNNGDVGQQQTVAPAVAQAQSAISPAASSTVQDTVDLADVWKKLDTKSTVWTLLIDDQAKVLTVSEYIGRFQKEGVKISAPPLHYVQMIDQVVAQNPQMLERPFGELIQMLAIIDYDFDNGMNKDDLAKKVLGEAGYEENKKRFAQAQAPTQAPPAN